MTTIEFLRRLIRKNEANTRHAQERHDDGALTRLDETRKHLFTALRAVEYITGTHADPYHYELHFHTEFPVSVSTKP